MAETTEDMLRRIERQLMDHDKKVDLAVSTLSHNADRVSGCTERIEHSLERLGDTFTTAMKRNGNGSGNGNGNGAGPAYKALDLAMKVILTLVGILALLTLGPASATKLLGQ